MKADPLPAHLPAAIANQLDDLADKEGTSVSALLRTQLLTEHNVARRPYAMGARRRPVHRRSKVRKRLNRPVIAHVHPSEGKELRAIAAKRDVHLWVLVKKAAYDLLEAEVLKKHRRHEQVDEMREEHSMKSRARTHSGVALAIRLRQISEELFAIADSLNESSVVRKRTKGG